MVFNKRSAPTARQAAPLAKRSSNEVLLPAKNSGISHLILKNKVFKKRSDPQAKRSPPPPPPKAQRSFPPHQP